MKRGGIVDKQFADKFGFAVADTPKKMHTEVLAWILENQKEKAA